MCTGAEKIQDAELEVMRVLWKAGRPAALADIRHALADRCGWEDSTVKTLCAACAKRGRWRWRAGGCTGRSLPRRSTAGGSARRLVGKVFDGSAKKLVASLLSDGQLSQADIDELSALLHRGEDR